MLLLFSVRAAELAPVRERAVHSAFMEVYPFVCVLISLLVLRVRCGMC